MPQMNEDEHIESSVTLVKKFVSRESFHSTSPCCVNITTSSPSGMVNHHHTSSNGPSCQGTATLNGSKSHMNHSSCCSPTDTRHFTNGTSRPSLNSTKLHHHTHHHHHHHPNNQLRSGLTNTPSPASNRSDFNDDNDYDGSSRSSPDVDDVDEEELDEEELDEEELDDDEDDDDEDDEVDDCDEDDMDSNSEDGQSSSSGYPNMSRSDSGRVCDCCYCEVFGHGMPTMSQTTRNYSEMRERLRNRLSKRKAAVKSDSKTTNCLPPTESPSESARGWRKGHGGNLYSHSTNQADHCDDRSLDELLNYINGTTDGPASNGKSGKNQSKNNKQTNPKNSNGQQPQQSVTTSKSSKKKQKKKNKAITSTGNSDHNTDNYSASSPIPRLTTAEPRTALNDTTKGISANTLTNSCPPDTVIVTSSGRSEGARSFSSYSASSSPTTLSSEVSSISSSSVSTCSVPERSINSDRTTSNKCKSSISRSSNKETSSSVQSKNSKNNSINGKVNANNFNNHNNNNNAINGDSKHSNGDVSHTTLQSTKVSSLNGHLSTMSNPSNGTHNVTHQSNGKGKESKSKSKTKKKLAEETFSSEDVSRPRDEMDDFELQLEAFKRFCMESKPLPQKKKVNLNLDKLLNTVTESSSGTLIRKIKS